MNLKDTRWVCTDEDDEAFGKTCVVTYGEVNPDFNGDNDIEILYDDGSVSVMKFRRFMHRFEKVGMPPIKEQYARLSDRLSAVRELQTWRRSRCRS